MSYSPLYLKVIAQVLRPDIEGGYSNDPDDSGGETNYGISDTSDGQRDHMADLDGDGRPDVAIINMTRDDAVLAFHTRYWKKMKLEEITDQEAVLQIFDFGVNAGPGTAIKLAQKIAGATRDGAMGPVTTALINKYPGNFLAQYKQGRKDFYMDLAVRIPKNRKYLLGWLARVDKIHLT